MKHRILSLILAGGLLGSLSLGAFAVSPKTAAAAEEDAPLRIMAMGDSITHGYINGDNGYRKYFCYDLQQAGFTNFDMVGPNNSWTSTATYDYNGTTITYDPAHAGYSGYAIQAIGNRSGILETVFQNTYTDNETGKSGNMLEAYQPDIILLQIGTNDVLDAQNSGIGDRLENLVDQILPYLEEDGDMLFLSTIPDIDVSVRYDWLGAYQWRDGSGLSYESDPEAFTAKVQGSIDSYNAIVKELVEKKQAEGKHIRFADIHSVVDQKPGLKDGVHPNESGYACMGQYWSEQVLDYLNNKTPSVTGTTTVTLPETTTSTTETTVTTTVSTSETTPAATESTTDTETTTTTQTTVTSETEPVSTEAMTTTTTATNTETAPVSTTTTTAETPAPPLGDVNLDGSRNLADAVALTRYLIGDMSLSYESYLQADVTRDQLLNGLDLALLRQWLLQEQA